MTTEKARITTVPIGKIEVEGIMLPEGTFGITVQQTTALFTLTKSHATRDIKTLLGKGSNLSQIKVSESTNNQLERYLTLAQFEIVLFELSLKGNEKAIEFARMMVGLSLTQLWSDAFGIKFDKEDRVEYLANRQEHKKKFHERLTKWWKLDGCQGKEYQFRVVEFKDRIGLPKYISVDDYDTPTLAIINSKEIRYETMRECGLSHEDAISKL